MYAIYHQIDREKREQEEKENEQNLVEELKQLEARFNLLVRRDSYSTITTRDTEMRIEQKADRKHLVPITWANNGELPVEISVPETRKDQNLLDSHESEQEEEDSQSYESPPGQKDDALQILQNTLFVDDEEELDLIFDDNQEDEMNVQRELGTPTSGDESLSSSESSESIYTDETSGDSEDLVRFESERFTRFEI